ncbi:DUF2381 family protein [Archangium gephyra]|uniref:DUF2381 family protein n=1 Tax=Archangium gephyra TaxID=48 RepID=UPI003B7A84E9
MPVLSSAALLRLVLLTAPVEAPVPSAPLACEAGTHHLALTADTPGEALAVCIHPGKPTHFFFDAKLAHVELPGRERFLVTRDDTGLALVPTQALEKGERVRLTFSFQEGTEPAGVTFTLVVHPSEAAGLVRVTRRPRSLDSYREGERQARADAQACRADKARLEAQCGGQRGLLGLRAQGLLGEDGIPSKDITPGVTSRPGNTLASMKALSYRSDTTPTEGGREVVRLAVEQLLKNLGSTPWTPAGAVLRGPRGEEWKALGVWPLEAIAPGKEHPVMMEVEVTEEEARGTFTLKWWGQEAGSGGDFFDGVTFP